MSVVEFSADSWQASAPGLQKGLADRIEALGELARGLESLAASGNISGQGADAMRAYIREVHVPIVQSMLVGLYTFQTAIGVYWSGYSQVDAGGNFRLVDDEFDAHLVQLAAGMGRLRGIAAELRSIAAGASHLVSLGGAGANAAERTVDDLERMHLIAKTQQETWKSYEATDHGFGQVKELVAELDSTLKNLGSLTVGQGRGYQSGSFRLTLEKLGGLTDGMLGYCQEDQQVAADGWEVLFSGYVADVEAEAERQRKEDALWGVLWDSLQIAAGAVIAVIGVGLTPFTGGFSLGLTVLGGSLVVGGVNSAINHVSIVSSGEELNLIGRASEEVGRWYDVTVAQPAIASGDQGLQFLAGVGSGLGQVVSEGAQLNVKEMGAGLYTLATDESARSVLWDQVRSVAGQVAAGDTFVMGQVVGNLVPIGAAGKLGKSGSLFGKVDGFGFGKPVKVSTPGSATSSLDWVKHRLGSGSVKVSDEFTPATRLLDRVQVVADKIQKGELTAEEIKALPGPVREQLRGVDRGDGRDIFGKYAGSDTISATKEALGLKDVGLDLGVDVIPDQVLVKFEKGGQGRRYDGLIHVEGNQYIGVEIKSGSAHARYNLPGNLQRQFDNLVSQDNPARGVLDGQPIEIIQVIDHSVS